MSDDCEYCIGQGEQCLDEHEQDGFTFRCTREEGHDGKHVACSPREHPAKTWRDKA